MVLWKYGSMTCKYVWCGDLFFSLEGLVGFLRFLGCDIYLWHQLVTACMLPLGLLMTFSHFLLSPLARRPFCLRMDSMRV